MARKPAFTLIELLVVLVVIALLVGMLVPAVLASREHARQKQCISNNEQLSLAIQQFAAAKDRMPYLTNMLVGSSGANTSTSLSWALPLFPFIEKNDIYQAMNSDITNPAIAVNVSLLICPSDALKVNSTNYPNPLSYAVNSGRWDTAGSTSYPLDWIENGVFYDQFATATHNIAFPASKWPQPQIKLDYIEAHDGSSATILLGENCDATQWQIPGAGAPAADLVSLIWQNALTVSPGLNRGQGTTPDGLGNIARPSSLHPHGFHLTFCDGHVQFVSDDIQYQVYAALMTPNGPQARDPGSTAYTTSSVQYSAGVPVAVSQDMLNP